MRLFLAATLLLLVSGCQSQTPDVGVLQGQISSLKDQNPALQQQLGDLQQKDADTAKQRDTCTAKFNRATILYDVGLFNAETRAWVIPVDVDPVIAPNKNGTYSHYDPKTQIETVHFKGKPAQ